MSIQTEFPACLSDDPDMLQLAQDIANDLKQPVYFKHWHGEIVKTVEPEND